MKKTRLKVGAWTWVDHVYKTNVVLLCCARKDVPKRLNSVVKKAFAKVLAEIGMNGVEDGAAARFVGADRCGTGTVSAIWLNPDVSGGVIAHESLHATFFTLNAKGLRLSDKSEEAYTYFMEWLFREIGHRVFR